MGILIAIVSFIVVVGILVLVHELGHFFAARRAGVAVEEFGFGFPPRLFAKQGKNTLISINWIPLGGFVKIKGIAGDDQAMETHISARDSFAHQSYTKRFLILFAGILMNMLLSWLLLTGVYALGFSESVDGQAIVTNVAKGRVKIGLVLEGSPAETVGIQTGDEIISVDGTAATSILSVQTAISANTQTTQLQILRDGQEKILNVPVTTREDVHEIGVGLSVKYPVWVSFWLGLRESIKLLGLIFFGLAGLVRDIFVNGQVSQGVVGPVGIAVISGQAVQLGVVYVLYFAALLSANLAIFNLLPLPALDGGRLLFLLIERIQGRPVNHKTEAIVHGVGFACLLLLAALITLRDVIHLVP